MHYTDVTALFRPEPADLVGGVAESLIAPTKSGRNRLVSKPQCVRSGVSGLSCSRTALLSIRRLAV